MTNKQAARWVIPILLIILGATARLLPHSPNFAPIAAIALFGGLYLPKKLGLVIPLIAMFISDLFIGFYAWPMMLTVYGSFLIAGLIGQYVKKRKSFFTILGSTLAASIIFFLATNAAVWAFGTMYSHDFSGLLQSYTMAIPFFKNTLLGDLFYTALLVGGAELAATTASIQMRALGNRS